MKKILFSFVAIFFLPMLIIPVNAAPNNIPQWQREMNERANELAQLQKQNNGSFDIDTSQPTAFPTTVDDLSFSARMKLETDSIEPYKDAKAYREYNFQSAEDWCPNHLNDVGCEMYKAKAEAEKNGKNTIS